MEDIRYRVQFSQNGKFYHFTSLSELMNHFTAKELMSMMKEEEKSLTKTSVAVVLNSEVIGRVSLNKIFLNLFKVPFVEA